MKLLQFVINLIFVDFIICHNSESSELNGIDESPFYDTIIFSDIADVLSEFKNNVNSPLDALINSDSESVEDLEELLSDYQHSLDKAQKQRKAYTDKPKLKNKVPFYFKTKPGIGANYNKQYFKSNYYNKQPIFPETQYANTMDIFIPPNSKTKYTTKSEVTTVLPKHYNSKIGKFIFDEKKVIDLPQIIYKSTYEPNKSSCFCKKKRMPCDCKCKQCMISLDSLPGHYTEHTNMYDDKKPFRNSFLSDTSFKGSDYVTEDKTADNVLNFRIKIDFSMPKTSYGFENLLKSFKPDVPLEYGNDYYRGMNLPWPLYNFPIPTDMVGLSKIRKFSKHDAMPLHIMADQKKKKSRANSNGKKNRKKLITFHNIKLEPQFFTTHFENVYNMSDNDHKIVEPMLVPNVTDKIKIIITTEKPYENQSLKENHKDNTIYLMVNITSNTSNISDVHKNENSVETNYYKRDISNLTTNKPVINKRVKRYISHHSRAAIHTNSSMPTVDLSVLPILANISKTTNKSNHFTNFEKIVLADAELLYWPSSNNRLGNRKNITALILEKEYKKSKINVSKETLRRNHTHALQQAIFGEVNWNDIDTIAPTFMSFVGKYIKGALTFCSESICHSMKCAEQNCVHRICLPGDRINNKGHCTGSNNTDSAVSMKSIMDLPSNIAFEIVDILHEKMMGKLFGKVTLCIMTKCITFAASKKTFTETKCSIKDLNTTGHCMNTKSKKKFN